MERESTERQTNKISCEGYFCILNIFMTHLSISFSIKK
jgi:hypothetical protein